MVDYDKQHSPEGPAMPMIDIYAPAGTFRDLHALATAAATTLMRIEGVPDIPMFRENTAAFVHELPPGAISDVDGASPISPGPGPDQCRSARPGQAVRRRGAVDGARRRGCGRSGVGAANMGAPHRGGARRLGPVGSRPHERGARGGGTGGDRVASGRLASLPGAALPADLCSHRLIRPTAAVRAGLFRRSRL